MLPAEHTDDTEIGRDPGSLARMIITTKYTKDTKSEGRTRSDRQGRLPLRNAPVEVGRSEKPSQLQNDFV